MVVDGEVVVVVVAAVIVGCGRGRLCGGRGGRSALQERKGMPACELCVLVCVYVCVCATVCVCDEARQNHLPPTFTRDLRGGGQAPPPPKHHTPKDQVHQSRRAVGVVCYCRVVR